MNYDELLKKTIEVVKNGGVFKVQRGDEEYLTDYEPKNLCYHQGGIYYVDNGRIEYLYDFEDYGEFFALTKEELGIYDPEDQY